MHPYEQQQQAWRWWQTRQQQQQQQRADAIRDGVMQQAFGFRRYLEQLITSTAQDHPSRGQSANDGASNGLSNPAVAPISNWLEQFNRFYQQLETLSNELLPPFVEDSLPLALQCLLNSSHPPVPLTTTADRPLPPPAPENVGIYQTVLAVVAELLPVLQAHGPQSWQAQLSYQEDDDRYGLSFTTEETATANLSSLRQVKELNYLQEVFRSLTSGTLEVSQDNRILTCRLVWFISASSVSPD
ncbi:MAG: hypothetical protein AAFZ80_09720 [Cyanobacteria bacterium P01_A01_bin.105]